MARSEAWNPPPGYDPAPNVASADDLRRADELRLQIEACYFDAARGAPIERHREACSDPWSDIRLDDGSDA
jgi:hypothetical protein